MLAPAIVGHDGPCFAVTSKPDLLRLTLESRAPRGPVYAVRLAQDVELPEGVTEVRIDPTATLRTQTQALNSARMLINAAAVENSGSADQSFWTNQAIEPLQALLWAYRPGGPVGGGIADLHRAIRTPLARAIPDPDDPKRKIADLSHPSWKQAAAALAQAGEPDLADALDTVAAMDARQRDSVAMSMKTATTAWADVFMRRDSDPVFTPDMLEPTRDQPRPTVHVIAPPDAVGGVAVCTLVHELRHHWRAAFNRDALLPELLLVIDELTNSLPLPGPSLLQMINDSRSYSMSLVLATQGSELLTVAWDKPTAEAILKTMPSVLILHGAREVDFLREAIAMTPQREEVLQHLGPDGRATSTTTQMRDSHTIASLLPDSISAGRLITGTGVGVRVELDDLDQILAPVARRASTG